MTEHTSEEITEVKKPSLFRRVAKAFLSWVLTIALSATAISIGYLGLKESNCPVVVPRYKAVPSDLRGKLEYCTAKSSPNTHALTYTYDVQPDSVCGQDKEAIEAVAAQLRKKAFQDRETCRTTETWIARWIQQHF